MEIRRLSYSFPNYFRSISRNSRSKNLKKAFSQPTYQQPPPLQENKMTSTSLLAWPFIKNSQFMKARRGILRSLIILCGSFVTTIAFGQTIYTWSGANGGDIGV